MVAELLAVVALLGVFGSRFGFLLGRNVQLVVLQLNVKVVFVEAGSGYLYVKTRFRFLNVHSWGIEGAAGVELLRVAAEKVFKKAVEWGSVAGGEFSQCHRCVFYDPGLMPEVVLLFSVLFDTGLRSIRVPLGFLLAFGDKMADLCKRLQNGNDKMADLNENWGLKLPTWATLQPPA